MPLDAETAQELIRQLATDRNAYLESVNKTHQLLINALASASGAVPLAPNLIPDPPRRNTVTTVTSVDVDSIQKGSTFTGEDDLSDDDDSASLYVQTPLEPETYEEGGLREHLRTYAWNEAGRRILQGVIDNEKLLQRQPLFPVQLGPVDDRSHLSHYSIFDVGQDGAPLPIKSAQDEYPTSRSLEIWNRLKSTNSDPGKKHLAVGKITIVREPSPLLFGALHYCFNKHFDVDELFGFLVDDDPALAYPHRAFDEDTRHRRTFVFTLEYFTIIGEDCQPMSWQRADEGRLSETHLPISRCSSVTALSLSGEPVSKVRNKDRRLERRFGDVHDPFAPWRVLSIQCYPDWKSRVDAHDSTKHYVNGPEAFLVTLRAEFHDARKRLMEVYNKVTDLVEPPADFIFSQDTRDKLLFEDSNFTYSRRYFWAYQSLGIMNQDIHDMVSTFRETFKESVWRGKNKIVWPGEETVSSKHAHWRKRMATLRQDIELDLSKLEELAHLNEDKMRQIKGLRDNLFSGTSVFESRKSVEQAVITVEQGRNIKLLTLVTIFFLPLSWVTGVFGMTNMPPNADFYPFAWVTIAICIPTYILIGSLNTTSGLRFWTKQTRAVTSTVGHNIAWFLALFNYRPSWTHDYHEGKRAAERQQQEKAAMASRRRTVRSRSTESAMLLRGAPPKVPTAYGVLEEFAVEGNIANPLALKTPIKNAERPTESGTNETVLPASRTSSTVRFHNTPFSKPAADSLVTSSIERSLYTPKKSPPDISGMIMDSPTALTMRSRDTTIEKTIPEDRSLVASEEKSESSRDSGRPKNKSLLNRLFGERHKNRMKRIQTNPV